jgi:hypothetical protein
MKLRRIIAYQMTAAIEAKKPKNLGIKAIVKGNIPFFNISCFEIITVHESMKFITI